MFCPICKSEYREGFTTCSDCHVPLTEAIPVWDSPEAFEVLWTGESATFQTRLLEELERTQIGAAGIPRDLLFRNSNDMLGVRREPRFGLAVCVQNADAPLARQILEKLLGEVPGDRPLEADAIPFSAREAQAIPELPLDWNSSAASVEVWSGTDKHHLEFVEASLHGVGIPALRTTEGVGTFRILIRPEDKVRAIEIVSQIETNTVPQEDLAESDYLWLDEPVKSYSLLGLIAALDLLALFYSYAQTGNLLDSIPRLLTSVTGFIGHIGELWMLYQAIRYEMRPWRFILIAIFVPFSFIWYSKERYSKRTGVRRLPVAMRLRMPPSSSA